MSIRLLVVEDRPQLCELLLESLSSVGHFTLAATRTTEAEANLWLRENVDQWDLAIVDLALEQGNGLSVVTQARSASADAAIVVLSDYVSPGMRAHCQQLGANAAFRRSTETASFLGFCASIARSSWRAGGNVATWDKGTNGHVNRPRRDED